MASRSLDDLHPLLVAEYQRSKYEFQNIYSNLPQPFVTSTYRSNDEQAALFAQGRNPLHVTNSLRQQAGLAPISQQENSRVVTKAPPGSSAHNPYKARAFDIAFIDINKRLDWSENLFQKFANSMLRHSNIVWGGHFKSFKDNPHFELISWRDSRWSSL